MPEPLASLIILVVYTWSSVYLAKWLIVELPWAFRTGIFRARGRVYLRAMHPLRYWMPFWFFPFLMPLCLLAVYMSAERLILFLFSA